MIRPSGTLTFLFSDITSSVLRAERNAQGMLDAQLRHEEIACAAVEARGGQIFKLWGDQVCAVFESALDAVCAAVAMQQAIGDAEWPDFGASLNPLRVAVGLHTGTASGRDGDYYGQTVNTVSRIMSAANGGQILLAQVTAQLAADGLPADVKLSSLGWFRLRGLRHAERLFEAVFPAAVAVGSEPRAERVSAPHDPDVERVLTGALDAVIRAVEEHRTASLDEKVLREAAVAQHRARTIDDYLSARVAGALLAGLGPDSRYVSLKLLVDRGEQVAIGRWSPRTEQYDDLDHLLDAVNDPAVVVLGSPGSGKSTILSHFELVAAERALRGDGGAIPFLVHLSDHQIAADGCPSPETWLEDEWTRRQPHLPPLAHLLHEGRVLLLLDGLNELSHDGPGDYRRRVLAWKHHVHGLLLARPGNRLVFTCRSLDYSTPLSSSTLPVPHLRIERLSDAQVRRLLEIHCPARAQEVWSALEGTARLELLRQPYFVVMLADQLALGSDLPDSQVALFDTFVDSALLRELERGNALFDDDELIGPRDRTRIARSLGGRPAPDGALVPRLALLAYRGQRGVTGSAMPRISFPAAEAHGLIDHAKAAQIVAAARDIGVIEEELADGSLHFTHQLLQEYFAARHLASAPEPHLVSAEWRADRVRPKLEEVIGALAPADPLPPAEATLWDETILLAAAMTDCPDGLIHSVMSVNLPLAGRCAGLGNVRVERATRDELRWALVARSRDPQADLRARIAAGQSLGALGDPRFSLHCGPDAECLVPPFATLPAGRYRVGSDDGYYDEEAPAHEVRIETLIVSRFPVTVAEFERFESSGGYADPRWWDTDAAREWLRKPGDESVRSAKLNARQIRARMQADAGLLDRLHAQGLYSDAQRQRWLEWSHLTDAEFELALEQVYVEERLIPTKLRSSLTAADRTEPVSNVSWFEARAYCNWLSAQLGHAFRLPTEVEWEAAARGREAARFAFGDDFDSTACNTLEAHVRRTTPIGIFPAGDTRSGLMDMCGNVFEWTSSLFGDVPDQPTYRYPYTPDDGREDPAAPSSVLRISRGGAWTFDHMYARCALRLSNVPALRAPNLGFRIVAAA